MEETNKRKADTDIDDTTVKKALVKEYMAGLQNSLKRLVYVTTEPPVFISNNFAMLSDILSARVADYRASPDAKFDNYGNKCLVEVDADGVTRDIWRLISDALENDTSEYNSCEDLDELLYQLDKYNIAKPINAERIDKAILAGEHFPTMTNKDSNRLYGKLIYDRFKIVAMSMEPAARVKFVLELQNKDIRDHLIDMFISTYTAVCCRAKGVKCPMHPKK